jgi:hypothetical protein
MRTIALLSRKRAEREKPRSRHRSPWRRRHAGERVIALDLDPQAVAGSRWGKCREAANTAEQGHDRTARRRAPSADRSAQFSKGSPERWALRSRFSTPPAPTARLPAS